MVAHRTNQQLPVVHFVGDAVHLSCHNPKPSKSATWDRSQGLPVNHRVDQGVLVLPEVYKEDEGIYNCIVVDDDRQHVSEVDLQVDDFVPRFYGEDPIELKPLTDEHLRSVDVVITLNSSNDQGLLFTTRRDKVEASEPLVLHEVRIRDGIIRYEYDVGYGREVIETANKVDLQDWNVVHIINDEHQAVIQLNDQVPTIRHHNTRPPLPDGVNGPIFIGGRMPVVSRRSGDAFVGVISSVSVSGKNQPLGDAKRPSTVSAADVCSRGWCLNGANCRTTNTRNGYTCKCLAGFHGDQCQWRSSTCRDENCNSGTCLENEETWQCVCPAGTAGLRCEQSDKLHEALGFSFDTSFVALPKPQTFESVRMTLKPQAETDEHVLLYVASEYGKNARHHLSISLVNNHIVYALSNGQQEMEKLQSVPLEPGALVELRLERDDSGQTVLSVNGHVASTARLGDIRPGTEIFIGGLPPGIETPNNIAERSFRGCIEQISINNEVVNLRNPASYLSGDITSCEEALNGPPSDEEDDKPKENESLIFPDKDTVQVPMSVTDSSPSTDAPESSTTTTTTTTPVPSTPEPTTIQATTTTEPITVPDMELIEPETTSSISTTRTTTTPEPATTTTTVTTTTETATTMTTTEEIIHVFRTSKDKDAPEPIPRLPEPTGTTTSQPAISSTDAPIPTTTSTSTSTTTMTTTSAAATTMAAVLTTSEAASVLPTDEGLIDYDESVVDQLDDELGTKGTELANCVGVSCNGNNTDACRNHTCGVNGECEARNATHYECRCKLYYDGPNCDQFRPIEHAARFEGDAFIELSADEFPHLTSEKDEVIVFKFKTKQPNGLLLWQGQRPTVSQMEDFIAIGIVNGHLHYSYELGGGAAHLISEERVDDGKEHLAKFERRGRRGLMQIDGLPEVRGISSGILAMLNVDGNIFIGGVPDLETSTGGLFSHNFVGCVADVELNGVRLDLMATAIDGKNVKPCDEWVVHKRWLKSRRRTNRDLAIRIV